MAEKPELDMAELDKFKRRLIRSVAHMLIEQKMPETIVWKDMKKVMGCDCLQLWEHMRSLTLKKLRRLLAAEDKSVAIPDVARMSVTDWLLYDQVLVHEDIDVIGLELMCSSKSDNRALIDLFALVQRYDIEGKVLDPLADAWDAAAHYYNSNGLLCSVMLLQKRWYQLKVETRRRFYEFWHSYRGNERQIPKAEIYRPTILQRTLAKRYPEVITNTFPDWDTCINEGFIILPEYFEKRKKTKMLEIPSDENLPDIVVMEPDIETIDLLQESESEDDNEKEAAKINNDIDKIISNVKIKEEPEDPVIDVTVVKTRKTDIAMAQVVQEESLFDSYSDDIVDLVAEEQNIITLASNFENKLRHIESGADQQEEIEKKDDFIPKITNVFGNVPMTDENLSIIDNITKNTLDTTSTTTVSAIANIEESVTNNVKEANTGGLTCLRVDIIDSSEESDPETDYTRVKNQMSVNKNVSNETSLRAMSEVTPNTTPLECDRTENAVLSKIADVNKINETNQSDGVDIQRIQYGNLDLSSFGDIPDDMNFADDGIEFADDGLLDVDQGTEKVQEGYNHGSVIRDTCDTSLNTTDSSSTGQEFKLDEKLFLDTVVYTQKLDKMHVLKNKDIYTINVKNILKKIIDESKPISDRSVDAEKARIEKNRISPSSYMLQKPKNRKYNPIQLCKNPDFNTRLRRLTAGFLSSWQNRTLLKACNPLTIDLMKSFESKLIDNTLYLKKPDINKVVDIDDHDEKTASVLPSVIPVQTLIDSTRLDDVLPLKSDFSSNSSNSDVDEHHIERNKTIHLPDIKQVRRINQSLLTAEVNPIQMQNNCSIAQSGTYINPTSVQTSVIVEHKPNNNISSTDAPNTINNPNVSTNNDSLNIINKSVVPPEAAKGVAKVVNVSLKSSMLENMLKSPARVPPLHNNKDDFIEVNRNVQSGLNITTSSVTMETQNRNKLQKKYTTNPNRVVWRPNPSKKQQLTWLEKSKFPEVKHDEFLLTPDTLNKLLHLFCGCTEPVSVNNTKTQKKDTVKQTLVKEPPPKKERRRKPKEKKEVKAWPSRKVSKVVYKRACCCWAREQIDFIKLQELHKRRSKHTCQYDNCTCCCRLELAKLIETDEDVALQPERNDQDNIVTETVVTDNTYMQTSSTQVPTISNVYSLSSTSDIELKSDATNSIVSLEGSIKDIGKPLPSLNCTVKSSTTVKPIINIIDSSNVDSFKKFENNMRVTRSTSSQMCSREIFNDPTVERRNLNIPIYDETRSNNLNIRPQVRVRQVGKNKLNIPIIDETKSVIPIVSDFPKSDAVVDVTIKISKMPNISISSINESDGTKKLVLNPITSFEQTNQNQSMAITADCSLQRSPCKSEVFKVTSGPSQNNKVLVLDSKQLTKTQSVGCPIYLGANKILLTDVTLPSPSKEEAKPIINIPQNEAPPLPLPPGVQLVLFANGKLAYTMLPGSELSPEDKARMPTLLETIQQQITLADSPLETTTTKSTNTSISDEIVDISDDETSSTPANVNVDNITPSKAFVQNNSKGLYKNDSPVQIEVKEPSKIVDVEETMSYDTNDNERTLPSQSTDFTDKSLAGCSQKDLEIPTNDVEKQNESLKKLSTDTFDTNPEHVALNEPTTSEHIFDRKSQDSEKSSANNDAESNNGNLSCSKKTILSDLMEMSGISAEDAAPVQVEDNKVITVPDSNNLITSLNNVDDNTLHSTSLSPNISQLPRELNTVSSFAELKYACQQNGQFYKLDVETGVVVPIKVCLKRKLKASGISELRITPKTTIDLTEDGDLPTETDTTEVIQPDRPVLGSKRSLLKMSNFKKVTMFNALQRPRILKRIDKKALPSELQIITTSLANSREVRLAYKAPLQQSGETSKQLTPEKASVDQSINLSDSSDEEPLIKKVRRKQANSDSQTDSNNMAGLQKLEGGSNLIKRLSPAPVAYPTALGEEDIRLFEDPPYNEVPMEVDSLPITLPKDQSDVEGEDCILGV